MNKFCDICISIKLICIKMNYITVKMKIKKKEYRNVIGNI